MDEQLVGKVTHYFGGPRVAAVEVTDTELRVGDTIRITGHTSNFTQEVESLEIDHKPVETAGIGDHVGIQLVDRARPNDLVFRTRPR